MEQLTKQQLKEQQKKAFKLSQQAGVVKEFAAMKGGTGELRKPLSHKEYQKRVNKRNSVKAARKYNR